MAEAIGIVAAALQFASIGNTILTSMSKLKGFSDKSKRLQSQVNQLLALTAAIRSRLPNDASDTLSQQLESVIIDCITQGRQMTQLLHNVAASPKDSIPGKKLKTVLGVLKEKQFEEICDHLERHKTFLSLYIANSNSILLENLTERFEKEKGACRNVLQESSQHENICNGSTASTSLIGIDCNLKVKDHEEVIQPLPQPLRPLLSRDDLAAIASVIGNTINARFLEMERNFHYQCASQARPLGGNGYSYSEERGGDMVSQVKLNSSLLDSGTTCDIINASAFTKLHPNVEFRNHSSHKPCNCRPRIRKINGILKAASLSVSIKLVSHQNACDTQAGCQRISLQIRAFNSALFKSSVSLDSRYKVSITQSLTIRPVVDFKASPAFRLFLDDFIHYDSNSRAYRLINDETKYERKVMRIHKHLVGLMREGKASPLDVNQYGETLISAALNFLECPAQTVSRHNPHIAKNLIWFLVSLGVPLNTQSYRESSPLWRIAQLESLFQHQKQGIDLALVYSDMGAELEDDEENRYSLQANYIPSTSPTWHIAILRYFPRMSKGLMCHKVLSAIISKSPQKLQKVLERDAIINGRNKWGQTALHLSASWAEGVSIMIQAGGDIDCVDNWRASPIYYAAGSQCLEAVDLLLQKNCALIFRGGSYLHIRSVLWDVLDTSDNIQSRIVSDLERRLNRLRNLDICHLSRNLFRSISCQTFGPYTLAILASTGLEKAGFIKFLDAEIREDHMVYSGHASIYYSGLSYLRPGFMVDSNNILWEIKSQGGDVEKRALSIFDKLYSAGFTSLDGYNPEGYTILQTLCLTGKLNGILWLLQKLQATPNGIRDSGANAMHCIAEYIGMGYRHHKWKDDQIEQTLRQLRLSGVDPLAKCCSMCACLADGNSPTATLTRTICQLNIQGIERRDYSKSHLRVWNAAIEGCSITSEQTYRQLVLSETFTRLGLTHTCSNKADDRNLRFRGKHLKHFCYVNSRDQERIDDVMEIQDEEKELIEQLDYWMSQYEVERATFKGTVEQFFDVWWERLPDHEPDFFPLSHPCPLPDYQGGIAWEVEVESDSN